MLLEEKVLTSEQREGLLQLIGHAKRVVLTGHMDPDGDCIGSCSALLQVMRALGKEAHVVMPNSFPDNMLLAPLSGEFIRFNEQTEEGTALLQAADLIFSLDYNGLGRMGETLERVVGECRASRVMIDHHLNPAVEQYTVCVSQPQMSSTCEVLQHVLLELGYADLITKDVATGLYLGLMTDTGNFSHASSRGEVFRCVAMLLDRGVDKEHVYRAVFWDSSEARMRLMGYLLYVNMQLLPTCQASIITMTNEEYRRFKAKKGDTEGFVNMPLEIQGIRLSFFMREDTETPGKIRISTRSVDEVPCNLICEKYFGGGGHKNAAGGSFLGTLDEAVSQAKKAAADIEKLMKQENA
ncbi:MAG: bifunctional oligoribonuclease/PAP phosphatase NrnA [Bacteroidaceae bacterium]|nr:bifunctional oligoribonuclease/PAP phosphatase NrnA [Prevotellaceae bacterium]MDY5632352.1 bifunctional oligoribonuclease/PAP phosphatase NrnA [Bacteroidaceae bacterium]